MDEGDTVTESMRLESSALELQPVARTVKHDGKVEYFTKNASGLQAVYGQENIDPLRHAGLRWDCG